MHTHTLRGACAQICDRVNVVIICVCARARECYANIYRNTAGAVKSLATVVTHTHNTHNTQFACYSLVGAIASLLHLGGGGGEARTITGCAIRCNHTNCLPVVGAVDAGAIAQSQVNEPHRGRAI